MKRRLMATIVLAAVALLAAAPAWSQTTPMLRVTRRTPIMMDPRADSLLLGTANPGEELEIIGAQPGWYGVVTPAGMRRPRGWIPASAVQVLTPLPGAPTSTATSPAESPKPAGRLMIRAFAAASGVRFAASDTFDAILGTPLAGAFGGGAEVVLPRGAFVRGSVDRFRRTGSLVLVSGTQIFTLDAPNVVSVTPIQITVGYRDPSARRAVGYFGVGGGWHVLREQSAGLPDEAHGHLGYHILGGAEFPVSRWLSFAAEAQWAGVPKSLGETGISAAFKEEDLGGASIRFRLIIGY
jgi:hypothetical protein